MAAKKKATKKAGAATAPAVPAKPTIYRRGDGYEAPTASLVQRRQGNRWILEDRETSAFVNDASSPFEGVEVRAE